MRGFRHPTRLSLDGKQERVRRALLLDPPVLNAAMKRAAKTHAALLGGRSPSYAFKELRDLAPGRRDIRSSGVAVSDEHLDHSMFETVGPKACYVAREVTTRAAVGCYTLNAATFRVPHHVHGADQTSSANEPVRVSRLSQFVVEKGQGRHLRGALLWDALERVASARTMSYAVVAVATDCASLAFYTYFGFELLQLWPRPSASTVHLL